MIVNENLIINYTCAEHTNSTEIIEELGKFLVVYKYVHPNYINAMLLREKKYPTGLGFVDDYSVAIPHAESQFVLEDAVLFCKLSSPVEFFDMEDPDIVREVKIVMMLAISDPNKQIDQLQLVFQLASSPLFLEELYNASDKNKMYGVLKKYYEKI